MQLDPWRPPSGRVQDCRVCHRRRQWTIRVPFHDRYKDVSARKGDKDILAMVGTSTLLLLMAGKDIFTQDISAHGKYSYRDTD